MALLLVCYIGIGAPTARPQLSSVRPAVNRRTVLQTAAVATAGALAPSVAFAESDLVWQPLSQAPVKVAKTSYQPVFVTYLARFLLNFDKGSAGWFADQMGDLPLSLDSREQLSLSALRSIRERQFGQFSESVEVGLQKFQGRTGVRQLFSVLRSRYGSTTQAKLQLALLFSLISAVNQPSDLIRRALGEADSGQLASVELEDAGSGYLDAPPTVVVSE